MGSNPIITILYKPDKNPTDCSSYRPICLLNTDHKLLSSLLATRLAKTIPQLINPDQTGFISQTEFVDNVRRTLNIIETAQKQNVPVGMATLDAEKAFDNVLWPYLFEILSNFGLHTTFINWLKALYKSLSQS